MAKPLTKVLYLKLLADVDQFIKNDCQATSNKAFLKMLNDLVGMLDDCEKGLKKSLDWKRPALELLEMLSHIYQKIPYDRWFHAYGSGIVLRDRIEAIFQNTLGVQPGVGYFSTNIMPVGDMDIAIDRYVGNPF